MKGSIYRDDRLMFNYELLDEECCLGEIEFTDEEVTILKEIDDKIQEGQRLLKDKYEKWLLEKDNV